MFSDYLTLTTLLLPKNNKHTTMKEKDGKLEHTTLSMFQWTLNSTHTTAITVEKYIPHSGTSWEADIKLMIVVLIVIILDLRILWWVCLFMLVWLLYLLLLLLLCCVGRINKSRIDISLGSMYDEKGKFTQVYMYLCIII